MSAFSLHCYFIDTDGHFFPVFTPRRKIESTTVPTSDPTVPRDDLTRKPQHNKTTNCSKVLLLKCASSLSSVLCVFCFFSAVTLLPYRFQLMPHKSLLFNVVFVGFPSSKQDHFLNCLVWSFLFLSQQKFLRKTKQPFLVLLFLGLGELSYH